jgi:hypothetical protein
MERVLDEISYAAPDKSGEALTIDADYVKKHVGDLAANTDPVALHSVNLQRPFVNDWGTCYNGRCPCCL